MNKGRNFFILMACLLVLGMLTFLTRTKMENRSGVVDNVRYILRSADNNVKNYDFYFTDELFMKGTLTKEDAGLTLYVSKVDSFDETIEDYLTTPYAYYYTIRGTDRENAEVDWHYTEDITESEKTNAPYERFTERVFISMIFGTEPYITLWQAAVVAALAIGGGLIIGKAEELWHILNKKPEEEDPKWEDMNGIKRAGIAVLIADAVLLAVFIFL